MNEQNTTSTELSSILNQENLLTEQVCLILRVAQKQERIDQKLQMLDEAKRLFGNDEKFNTTLITDEIKLIKIHAQVEKNYRVALYNKSVYETIGELIRKGLLDEAEKTRKEFKISDTSESWWHIKAKHLAVNGNMWDELERFSKSRKSPIGYEVYHSKLESRVFYFFYLFIYKSRLLPTVWKLIMFKRPKNTFLKWLQRIESNV